jgi:hypothetical protein
MRSFLAAIVGIGLATNACAAADTAAMAATASGFYDVYKTIHPSDGVPSATNRARYAPFLSATLIRLLSDADAAEIRFAKANKGSPPLIEGDLFTSLFEGATSVAVGTCDGDDKSGHCAIMLEYVPTGEKPVRWNDTLYLVHGETGWRVDDIGYGGTWEFGNKGRLSETLKEVIGFQ